MALRLRRGTESERQNLVTPLLEGELIYVTDTGKLYIGNGTATGGVEVIGSGGGGGGGATTLDALTDTDLLGLTDGDVLTYIGASNKWEPVPIPGVSALEMNDISNVDITTLNALDILIYDGFNFITIPVQTIFAEQQNWRVNIVGDDSTILVDTDTNSFRGILFGSVEGNVTGDIQGSVFGDDSTVIVDGISKTISPISIDFVGDGYLTTNGNRINFGFSDSASNTILAHWNPTPGITQRHFGITNGDTGQETAVNTSRGTLEVPVAVQAGDILSAQYFAAYEDTSADYTSSTAIVHYLDPNATVSGTNVPGSIALFTIPDGDPNNTENALTLDSEGLVSIGRDLAQARATLDIGGTMALSVLTAAPSTPVDGMIAIADGSTWNPLSNGVKSMVVYLDSGWREIAVSV